MFQPKATVKEKPTNALITIQCPCKVEDEEKNLLNLFKYSKTKIVSIDPGSKNYAIRISERNNRTGSMKSLYYSRWMLEDNIKNDRKIEIDRTFTSLYKLLNNIKDLIIKTDLMIIERQLPINYNSTRIMQDTISYFNNIYSGNETGRYPTIVIVAPQLKGKMLGAPKGLPKAELKKWSVDVAYDFLEMDNDLWAINILNSEKKKDDLADVVTQLEAFIIYFEIDKISTDIPVKIKIIVKKLNG